MFNEGALPSTTPRRISSSAVIGFVFALLGVFPLGIAFSIGGLLQTQDGEKSGRGLAIAGVVISVLTVIPLLWWYYFARG
ncbi:hypothetical protein [Pengzhenrongella phosphoraccumulans]|uniref:hypothetical protein n=1 Tax=Pengzhenrongella phosphoraccumulans TaxID=3114394 RepID=UPI00388DA638